MAFALRLTMASAVPHRALQEVFGKVLLGRFEKNEMERLGGKKWWKYVVKIGKSGKNMKKKRNIWKKWSNFGEVGVFHKSLKLKFLQADFVTKKSTSFCQTLQGRLI